ncbi:MAG: hypothetical protein QOE22_534 [Candidatus Parcubacteria bacterium]|jgi:hypothetical protein|nr:hypothetical protein [Candidatus Parcubacteria bacterium]
MRDALIIFVAIILAIVIGGYLFLNGGPEFNPGSIALPQSQQPASSFWVLAEGQDAGGVDRRTNFRIMTDDEFRALWSLVYGTGGPAVPAVDFSKDEVIAVFDGSHSSGGYRVEVTGVTDAEGKRTVSILREMPGEDCTVTAGITSPFQIVRVPKTSLPLAKEEQSRTRRCGP